LKDAQVQVWKANRAHGARDLQNSVKKARLNTEKEAFIWLLYHSGSRKSESYELTTDQLKVTPEFLIVDYERKKHSAKTPPLKFSRSSPE